MKKIKQYGYSIILFFLGIFSSWLIFAQSVIDSRGILENPAAPEWCFVGVRQGPLVGPLFHQHWRLRLIVAILVSIIIIYIWKKFDSTKSIVYSLIIGTIVLSLTFVQWFLEYPPFIKWHLYPTFASCNYFDNKYLYTNIRFLLASILFLCIVAVLRWKKYITKKSMVSIIVLWIIVFSLLSFVTVSDLEKISQWLQYLWNFGVGF